MSNRIGIIATRKSKTEFNKAVSFGSENTDNKIVLDRLTTPIISAYERYLKACKERGVEPGERNADI